MPAIIADIVASQVERAPLSATAEAIGADGQSLKLLLELAFDETFERHLVPSKIGIFNPGKIQRDMEAAALSMNVDLADVLERAGRHFIHRQSGSVKESIAPSDLDALVNDDGDAFDNNNLP